MRSTWFKVNLRRRAQREYQTADADARWARDPSRNGLISLLVKYGKYFLRSLKDHSALKSEFLVLSLTSFPPDICWLQRPPLPLL